MKKLRRILKAAWRNARIRLEAVPAVVWLARWLSALTPVGWAVSIALVAGAVAAVSFGWIEGFVVAVMGLVALVVAIASVASPSPLSVSLRMKNDRIVAGQVAVGRVRVVNESARRSGSTLVEVTIGRGSGEFLVPPISGNGTWNEAFSVMTKAAASSTWVLRARCVWMVWACCVACVRGMTRSSCTCILRRCVFLSMRRACRWTSRAWPARS